MSIDKDPEVYKLLIAAIVGLVGILNTIQISILNRLKKTDEKIFERMNKTDHKLTETRARCEERHKDKKK